ncbi:MAG: hypothetical protein IJH63_02025 [Methanobrevibacter sp.]|nr:hypothetical protein [Methanobrevibacter sp.]
MASENLIKIILAIEDKFSEQAKKADDMVKKFGDSATQSNNKAAQSADKINQKYISTSNSINRVADAVQKVGSNGVSSFKNMDDATQKAVVNFNRLDEQSQNVIRHLSNLSDANKRMFINTHAYAQEAIAKFDALQNETRNWGNTFDYTRSKMQLMGTNVDSIKGKIQVVGSTVKTYMGNSWDAAKNKVTVFGNYIQSHLSNALTSVKNKIQSLGDAFGGLGGVLSSVFGGIGLTAMADMTIGASISRERIETLSVATLGYGKTLQQVEDDQKSLWNQMDALTNGSLVSLDQLSQAASVVAMTTHANESQMATLIPILDEIGQKAILMGKSGEEAIGLMQAAGKGLNGEFEMLRENFGINKEMLENAGWDGSAADIDGYTKALAECLKQSGDVSGMMETTHGKLTRLKKMWGLSARSLGDDFKPMVDAALNSVLKFVDANNDGKVDAGAKGWMKYAAGAITAASAFATLAPSISPVLQCLDMFWSKGKALLTFLGVLEAEEGALTLSTLANTIATKANSIAQAARGVETVALSGEEIALAATTAGLTTEEIAAAAAHSANGIAMEAEGIAAIGAAGGTTTLTGALWGMFTALLSNPLTWVVVALVALAVAVYEVGKAFGWWKDIPTMMQAVWAGIQRLWDAFIHHPDVQATIQVITDAWNWLCWAMGQAKKYVEDFFDVNINGEFDVVHAIIEGIGVAWQVITMPIRTVISIIQFLIPVFQSVASAVQTAQSKFGAFGGFLATMASPIIFVWELLRKIVCILLGCSPGIVPALRKTWEVFQEVFNAIAGFVSGIISPIVEAIRPLIDIFVEIVTYLVEMFMPAWNLLSNILLVIWNAVSQLINIFQAFLSGQITLPQMLTMIWNLIMTAYMTILTMIINFVFQWAGQIVSAAINAASGFVNGIITYISGLPGRFFSYLAQTTSNIINAGSQWVNTARQKASEMVNSASTTVQQLPGKIYTEFTKVPDRIREAIPQAIAAALNFGKEIINGVLNAMGIHSPGIVQNSITDEFKNSVQKIKDAIKPAGEYARQVGAEIVDKFGEPKLSLDTDDLMPYYDLDENPLENVDLASMDLSSVSGGLDSAMGMTDDTNVMIGESYDALATMMMTTLQNMVLQDQLAYGQIQSNDLATFQNISTGLNLNLLSMSNNLRTQLNLMLLTHRTAMTSATNTTRQQLALMLNETMKVTSEMRSAWAVMADSIISAAARIKNEATAYFDQLSSTIGTFYRKLQNPSQWAGGDSTGSPSTIRRVGRDPAVMTRITRGVANSLRRDNQLPYTITAVKAMDNGLVSPVTLEYMDKTASDNLNLIDLIQRGACPNCFAGGWDAVADPNIAYIKQTAREWQMKGPAVHTGVGDIDTGLSFRVKDFEGGTPHISWESFVRIATAIASAIPYELYYNSDAHGSWQNAIAAGSWNCYDGASAMVALANTCGYGGYVDCGLNWGGFGHCAAIINGYTFDTTALRQRGGWTAGPCSYSHPAPSAGGPINVHIPGGRSAPRTHSNPLEGLFDNNNSKGNVEEVKLTLEHKVDVTVDGNVENIDTDALIKELTESVTDKRLIDRIADALIKRDKRIARMGGA